MAAEIASWHGTLRDAAGHVVGDAAIVLHAVSGDREYAVKSSASGQFAFVEIASGSYTLRVTHDGKTWNPHLHSHRSLGQRTHQGLQRILRLVSGLVGVVVRVDAAQVVPRH